MTWKSFRARSNVPPHIPTVEVIGRVTATLHDGKNMIVLKAGEPAVVAVTSVAFLQKKEAIEPDAPPVDDEPWAA